MHTTLHKEEAPSCLSTILFEQRFTVLILDSGVGGLSIYDKLRQFLPNLHYLYVFDNIAFPYGEKSEEFIIKRVLTIVDAIQQRHPLALAIIACNTASTVSLYALREKFPFPIVGVVPAIKPAAYLTINGIIGLLATHSTIKNSYTHELITRFAKKCKIKMLGSTELVKLAENKLHGKNVSLKKIYHILYPWLRMSKLPDTIVLGCTHFSFLRKELLAVLPIGTRLVDAREAIAHRTAWLLKNKAINIKSSELNKVFCMTLNIRTIRLLPVLHWYGFKILEILTL